MNDAGLQTEVDQYAGANPHNFLAPRAAVPPPLLALASEAVPRSLLHQRVHRRLWHLDAHERREDHGPAGEPRRASPNMPMTHPSRIGTNSRATKSLSRRTFLGTPDAATAAMRRRDGRRLLHQRMERELVGAEHRNHDERQDTKVA